MSAPESREPAASPCQAPAGYWGEDDPGRPVVTLRLLVLKTQQAEAVRAFYQAVGVAFVEERHGTGPVHFAGQVGAVVLEIYPLPADAVADRSTRLGFGVPDLAQGLAAVRAAGAAVLTGPTESPWGTRAVVQDPDGRAVELYQHEGRSP